MAMLKVSPAVTPLMQPSGTECWLTCLVMLHQWKSDKGNKSVVTSKTKIQEKMDQSPSLFPYYMEKAGIAPGECKETAKMLGLRWSGDGDFTADILHEMISTYGPLWVAGMWRKGSSHVIVVTGVNKDTGNIKIVDPWENYSGTESDSTVTWLNQRGSTWKACDASVMYWGK